MGNFYSKIKEFANDAEAIGKWVLKYWWVIVAVVGGYFAFPIIYPFLTDISPTLAYIFVDVPVMVIGDIGRFVGNLLNIIFKGYFPENQLALAGWSAIGLTAWALSDFMIRIRGIGGLFDYLTGSKPQPGVNNFIEIIGHFMGIVPHYFFYGLGEVAGLVSSDIGSGLKEIGDMIGGMFDIIFGYVPDKNKIKVGVFGQNPAKQKTGHDITLGTGGTIDDTPVTANPDLFDSTIDPNGGENVNVYNNTGQYLGKEDPAWTDWTNMINTPYMNDNDNPDTEKPDTSNNQTDFGDIDTQIAVLTHRISKSRPSKAPNQI